MRDILVLCPLKGVLLRVPLQTQNRIVLGFNRADVHLGEMTRSGVKTAKE
jgi:hypothetical protein